MKSWKVFGLVAIGAVCTLTTGRAASSAAEIRPVGKPVKLNNLVTELVRIEFPASGQAEYPFENPREGWVFFSVPAEAAASGKVMVSLDKSPREQAILSRTGGRHGEAMRWLPTGNHSLTVWADGKPAGVLVVRTMPEVILTTFQGEFHSPDGSPAKKLFTRHVPAEDRLLLYYWAWESYLWEQPSVSEAKACLEKLLCQRMRDFRKEFPGGEKRCVLCPSILDDWDCRPDVDDKVWLDMQMNAMVRDPAFDGLYGIAPYQCRNADPEMMRWLSALYRHYCIEGSTELLSARFGYTLMTEYLKNADFAAGGA